MPIIFLCSGKISRNRIISPEESAPPDNSRHTPALSPTHAFRHERMVASSVCSNESVSVIKDPPHSDTFHNCSREQLPLGCMCKPIPGSSSKIPLKGVRGDE